MRFYIVEIASDAWEEGPIQRYFGTESNAEAFRAYAEGKDGVRSAVAWEDGTSSLADAKADLDGYDLGYEPQESGGMP